MKKFLIGAVAAAAAITALGSAGSAAANIAVIGETSAYNFNVADPSAGLGAGPFGTVSVLELSATTLQLTIDLNDPTYQFHNGNDNHPALAFNLAGSPAITFNFTSPVGGNTGTGTFAGAGGVTPSPFGSFGYSVTFTDANPPPTPFSGPLVFTISSAGGLDVSSFTPDVYNNQNIYFTADLIGNGKTGNVGATLTGGGGGVPEPATWAMMLLGFGGMGALLRRRRQVMAAVA